MDLDGSLGIDGFRQPLQTECQVIFQNSPPPDSGILPWCRCYCYCYSGNDAGTLLV